MNLQQLAPYPPDTRAKGWRFELDYEQIEQSSTWALAGPEGRPWLLMMWMTSWRQVPCGSMPADEEVIAALIGMPEKLWAKHRKALMRGWDAAEDGRLYHKTVTARVLEMIDYRAKQAKRVADFKLRQREQLAANSLANGEQQDSNDTGTGTGTSLKDKSNTPPASRVPPDEKKTRSSRKCPPDFSVTESHRAWALEHAPGIDLDAELDAMRDYTFAKGREDWDGTFRNWLRKAAKAGVRRPVAASPVKSFREHDADVAAARVASMGGAAIAAKRQPISHDFIDMEATYAAPRLVG